MTGNEQILNVEQVLGDVDYILCVVLEDNTLKFVGQGFKWRVNPLHPRGWKKLTTAQGYAVQMTGNWHFKTDWKIKEIKVCERQSVFRCLSSYAITRQNHKGDISRE